jgi:glucose-6-phosphate 1-dehydrogenase
MNTKDCTIVLLGATGDLARKKIIPALYTLFVQNKLGNSIIIGAALSDVTKEELLAQVLEHSSVVDKKSWNLFTQRFFYKSLDFGRLSDFEQLAEFVRAQQEIAQLPDNRLIYCATAAYFFCEITKNCAESGLARKVSAEEKIWHRIVYEKPFGKDLQSAHQINKIIAEHFNEQQIFRIDHYLTKELVANIALVRFTNCILEPLWNNRYIDQVQIILDEKTGVEGRGDYYDTYGALADVVQNHMMELLALVGMESPEKLGGDYIRTQRAKVLEKVKVVDVLLGQYDGYQKEEHVTPDSKTETFAAAYLRIDNPRWAGVPFYLKTGKCLDAKRTMIYIKFKQVDCLLSRACPGESNALTIEISPNSRFALTLNAKKPGKSNDVQPVQMELCSDTFVGPHMPEAYESLFEEIIRGEQLAVSVRFDEIEYAWNVVDTIKMRDAPVYSYEKGSRGPKELETEFERKHGMRWKL